MNTEHSKTAQTTQINNWNERSKQLKSQFPQLTETDLKFETGKEEELYSRMQTKLGKNRQETLTLIENAGGQKDQNSPQREQQSPEKEEKNPKNDENTQQKERNATQAGQESSKK